MCKVEVARIDDVLDRAEDNDRELIRDFVEYANQATKYITVFKLKIDKMNEVNKMILEPIVGA
jgi:hypothetical protein